MNLLKQAVKQLTLDKYKLLQEIHDCIGSGSDLNGIFPTLEEVVRGKGGGGGGG